jgi:hypothetical protein
VRGIVQLASDELYMLAPRPFPEAVEGIRIAQEFSRLHLLHSAAGFDEPGLTVARMVLHYADGEVREIPIIAGEDLADWRPQPEICIQPVRGLPRSSFSKAHGTIPVPRSR